MIALLQRVNGAWVKVDSAIGVEKVAEINKGLLVFLAVEKNDTEEKADKLLKKILAYRIFSDQEGKMNLSVQDIAGDLLLVSQFTLAADTTKGLRPGFSSAMPPPDAERLYDYFVAQARQQHESVECGKFAADMKVGLENDGPVTFILQV